MEPSGSPLTGAAVQNLRWQTLILHIKEAPNGFKLFSVEDRGTFLVKYIPCFRANEALDWLVANGYATSAEEAIKIGQRLIDDEQICQVPKKKNCIFKDEKQFYRFMEAKEQKRAKQKVKPKTASPDLPSSQGSPNGAGTPRVDTPPPDTVKRGSSDVLPSQITARPESLSALVQADCAAAAAHMEYLPSSAVTLPAEATPEEWMEWMLVTQAAEERAGFINVYLAWMQPIEFVNLLRRVYAKLKAPCSERQLNYLEKHSLDVLTEWLNSTQAQRLLASDLVDKLKMFFVAELTSISAIKANRALSTAQLKDEQRQDPLKYGGHPQGRIRSLLTDITMHQGLLAMTPSLLNREDVTVREITETLTMNQFLILKQLQPCELLSGAWQHKEKAQRAPTIVALTEQFNFNAQWLMEELATASEDTVRTEVLEKAIKIAALALDMRNFLLTASMLAGLNGLIGVRATAISSSAQRTLESLLPLSDPAGFHKNLNARIADLCPPGSKHAGIPFLPYHLTTLVQAEEASPSWIDGKINVAKMRHLNAKIAALLRFKVAAFFALYRPMAEEQLERLTLVQIVK